MGSVGRELCFAFVMEGMLVEFLWGENAVFVLSGRGCLGGNTGSTILGGQCWLGFLWDGMLSVRASWLGSASHGMMVWFYLEGMLIGICLEGKLVGFFWEGTLFWLCPGENECWLNSVWEGMPLKRECWLGSTGGNVDVFCRGEGMIVWVTLGWNTG